MGDEHPAYFIRPMTPEPDVPSSAVLHRAFTNAKYAESMLQNKGPDIDYRYWAGQVDAYVAVLRLIDRNVAWLDEIRSAVAKERAAATA